MINVKIMFMITVGLLLAACGNDDTKQNEKATTTAAAPAPMAKTTTEPAMMAHGATRYIDHTMDEIEFRLKKSLAGFESMLEDASDAEQRSTIKENIAALKSNLAEL